MVDVILLGTGATMPTPERGVSAAFLRCGGRSILFDCGEGTQLALRREKVSPIKIDLIALTHYHGDHIFGLPGLLQTMNCLKRTDPLYITGPDGLEVMIAPILQLVGETDYEIRLFSFENPFGVSMKEFNEKWPKGAWLQKAPTMHRVPSQGYTFHLNRMPKFIPEKATELGIPVQMWRSLQEEDPVSPIRINGEILHDDEGRIIRVHRLFEKVRRGIHVSFSGDTMPSRIFKSYAYDSDLLIHDATYGSDEQAEEAELWGHSTFSQAAEIASEANARLLWLTHYSQSMGNPEEFIENALSVFPCTECGYDGKRITLTFTED